MFEASMTLLKIGHSYPTTRRWKPRSKARQGRYHVGRLVSLGSVWQS